MIDLKLTQQERQLLHDLLASKERGLLVEARRTDSFRLRDALRNEIRTVNRLMQRLDSTKEDASRPALPTGPW
jgi:hypothetical protein